MNAHETTLADRDWWMGHVLIALFVMLVAAILRVVPGWSAPLHAWVTLAASVVAVLAGHAALRGVASGWRRQWGAALLGLALAAGLGLASVGLLGFGRWVGLAGALEIPVDPREAAQ